LCINISLITDNKFQELFTNAVFKLFKTLYIKNYEKEIQMLFVNKKILFSKL